MKKNIYLLLMICSSALFAENNATYIGDKACTVCHAKEVKEWKGSHHDMAMKKPTEETVAGDFNNATFELNGVKSEFYKKEGKFFIKTDNEKGKMQEYEVAYTFGIYPLQQYLLKFPDGKYQIPDIAWDSRSKEEGGQKWFHIHKEEVIKAGDVLHWSGPNLNWNYMCADCHSTNLKKNYDEKSKSYHTTWDIINVSCEACHGPASKHIEWSKTPHKILENKGFPLSFKNKKWKWDVNTKDKMHGRDHQEIEVCAKCHSRRAQLDDDFVPGDKFSDHYLAVQLNEGLYFPDGKIEDEVYVYNSFKQSKMYAAGVTCSDCHNPHTLERKSEGDKVCYTCHSEQKYTATSHHKHKAGSTGSSCISCHMPARIYMGVDSRNDHSFRVPRPDVSVEMKEIPNACNLCHTDKDAEWATKAMKAWYGEIPVGKQNFAHDLQALRHNDTDAPKALYKILMSNAPDIAKATASSYLGVYPSKQTYMTTMQMLSRPDEQIRRSALQALEAFPPKMRLKKTFEMLSDPVKIVRMEAARQLASFPVGELDAANQALLKKSLDAYENTLLFNAERPEYQLSLANYYLAREMPEKAQKAFEESLRLQSQFVPSYINYSNFLIKQGKMQEAYDLLQKGIKYVPDTAILYHMLGLWYIQNKKPEKAEEALKRAVELDRDNTRFAYVYAVAVGEKRPEKAIEILEKVYTRHKGDLQVVSGLVYYYKKTGDLDRSKAYESKLKALQNFSVR